MEKYAAWYWFRGYVVPTNFESKKYISGFAIAWRIKRNVKFRCLYNIYKVLLTPTNRLMKMKMSEFKFGIWKFIEKSHARNLMICACCCQIKKERQNEMNEQSSTTNIHTMLSCTRGVCYLEHRGFVRQMDWTSSFTHGTVWTYLRKLKVLKLNMHEKNQWLQTRLLVNDHFNNLLGYFGCSSEYIIHIYIYDTNTLCAKNICQEFL